MEGELPAREHLSSSSSSSSSSVSDQACSRLKAQFERLKAEYKRLKAEFDDYKRTRELELEKRDQEINRLKAALTACEGDARVKELEYEIQSLLGSNIEKDTAISKLRFQLAAQTSDIGNNGIDGAPTPNKAELALELAERKTEISQLNKLLAERDRELEAVRMNIAMHNDQVAASQIAEPTKKKKKSWFGGGSSKKNKTPPPPAYIITDDIGGTPTGDGAREPDAVVGVIHLQRMQEKYKKQQQSLEQTVMSLERNKSRLETELEMVVAERLALSDKVARLEQALEAYRADAELAKKPATFKSVLTVPAGASNQADLWKAVAQRQESALKNMSVQKERLELQLKALSSLNTARSAAPPPGRDIDTEMREELRSRWTTLRDTQAALLEAQNRNAELTMKLDEQERRTEHYKRSAVEMQHLWEIKSTERHKDTAALGVLASVVAANEDLQEKLFLARQTHREAEKLMQGEIRTLRQGRAAMFKGDAPYTRVFPSTPQRNIAVFRHDPARPIVVPAKPVPRDPRNLQRSPIHEIARKEVEPSVEEEALPVRAEPLPPPPPAPEAEAEPEPFVEDEESVPDPLANYYYEWANGKYELRKGRQPTEQSVQSTDSGIVRARLIAQTTAEEALRHWNNDPPPPAPVARPAAAPTAEAPRAPRRRRLSLGSMALPVEPMAPDTPPASAPAPPAPAPKAPGAYLVATPETGIDNASPSEPSPLEAVPAEAAPTDSVPAEVASGVVTTRIVSARRPSEVVERSVAELHSAEPAPVQLVDDPFPVRQESSPTDPRSESDGRDMAEILDRAFGRNLSVSSEGGSKLVRFNEDSSADERLLSADEAPRLDLIDDGERQLML